MKAIIYLSLLAVAGSTGALGQAAPKRVHAAETRFSIDTTIGVLLANPSAKAAIDKHIPGFSKNPQVAMFAPMTMRRFANSPHASIPAARIQLLQKDLTKIR